MDLKELINQLDFTEENLRSALVSQATLLMQASRYRVKKLRDRLAAEANLAQQQSEWASRIRRISSKSEKKVTEAYIKEEVSGAETVVSARQELDEAKVLEEQAKLLVDAYQSRGSMIKSLVQLIGSEAAVERGIIQSALEESGLKKLKARVRNKYPGGTGGDDE